MGDSSRLPCAFFLPLLLTISSTFSGYGVMKKETSQTEGKKNKETIITYFSLLSLFFFIVFGNTFKPILAWFNWFLVVRRMEPYNKCELIKFIHIHSVFHSPPPPRGRREICDCIALDTFSNMDFGTFLATSL